MLSNKSLLVAVFIVLCLSLSAFSISDSELGQRYGAMDARSFAMGGAGVFNDNRPAAFIINPANLILQDGFAGLYLNTAINRAEDVRMVPLYNSFDVYIDDSVLASNINAFNRFGGAAFAGKQFGIVKLGLGGFYTPFISYDGKYREEIRNDRNTDDDAYPEKIAQNDIENSGTISKAGFSFASAVDFADYWQLGLGLGYSRLFGEVEQLKTIKWTDWSVALAGEGVLPEYSHQKDWEVKGGQLHIGSTFRMGPRFGLGFSYIPKATLDRTGSDYLRRDAYRNTPMDSTLVDMKGDFILPTEIKAGFSYFPRNVTRTVFNFDLEMMRYSEVNQYIDDVYNFYAGVEHHITNRMPMRLGFQAVSSYLLYPEKGSTPEGVEFDYLAGNKIISPMITAGSSVQLMKNVVLDLGFGYAWREYEALDLFPDGYYNDKRYTGSSDYLLWPRGYINLVDRTWDNPDKVKENFITLNAGISLNW